MMWNWLVSGLLLKSTIYLYDGSPFYPNAEVLWNFVDSEKINFMGVSAKYIDALSKENLKIIGKYIGRFHSRILIRTLGNCFSIWNRRYNIKFS